MMTAQEIVHSLECAGYTLTVVDGKVRGDRQDMLPPPLESSALLGQLRQHKGEVLDLLLYRRFTEVPPASGDYHEITFPASDETQMKRWAMAARRGLIHLTGPVQLSRATSQCRITFRCNQPLEWLADDITSTCKQEYNRVLAHIEKGTAWLDANQGSPEYQRAHDGYQALWEDLRVLYLAIDEALADPMAGYDEGVVQ